MFSATKNIFLMLHLRYGEFKKKVGSMDSVEVEGFTDGIKGTTLGETVGSIEFFHFNFAITFLLQSQKYGQKIMKILNEASLSNQNENDFETSALCLLLRKGNFKSTQQSSVKF